MKHLLIKLTDEQFAQLKQTKGKRTWLELLLPEKHEVVTLAAVEELIDLKLSKLKRGY